MPDSISMPSSIAARVKGFVIGTPYGSEADLASGKAGILADHVAAARIAGARPGARVLAHRVPDVGSCGFPPHSRCCNDRQRSEPPPSKAGSRMDAARPAPAGRRAVRSAAPISSRARSVSAAIPDCAGTEFEDVELSRTGRDLVVHQRLLRAARALRRAETVRALRDRRGRARTREDDRARPGRCRCRRRASSRSGCRWSSCSRRSTATATPTSSSGSGSRPGARDERRGRRPRRRACTPGASGAAISSSTACTRRARRSRTRAWAGATCSSCRARRRCAAATLVTSRARPLRRRSAGRARRSTPRTPPAPRARRRWRPRARRFFRGSATSRSSSVPTRRPRAFSRRPRAIDPRTRTGCAFISASPTRPTSRSTRAGAWTCTARPSRTSPRSRSRMPHTAPRIRMRGIARSSRLRRCSPRRWSPIRCACCTSAQPPTAAQRS